MEISPEELIHSLEMGNPVIVNEPTLNYLREVLPELEEVGLKADSLSLNHLKWAKYLEIKCILHILSLNSASLTGIAFSETLFCKHVSRDNHVLMCVLLSF